MEENKHSSRGVKIEVLFLVASLEATINHLFESLEFLEADLTESRSVRVALSSQDESGIATIDERIHELELEIASNKQMIGSLVRVRREYMASLNINNKYWCPIKHICRAVEHATEIYSATGETADYEHLREIWTVFTSLASKALGIGYTDCLRCLEDRLQEKLNNEKTE